MCSISSWVTGQGYICARQANAFRGVTGSTTTSRWTSLHLPHYLIKPRQCTQLSRELDVIGGPHSPHSCRFIAQSLVNSEDVALAFLQKASGVFHAPSRILGPEYQEMPRLRPSSAAERRGEYGLGVLLIPWRSSAEPRPAAMARAIQAFASRTIVQAIFILHLNPPA